MMSIGHWRYQRFHVSYLLGWCALGMLLGLALARWLHLGVSPLGLLVFAISCLPSLRSRRWWTVVIVVGVGLMIGMARGVDFSSKLGAYDIYEDNSVSVTGQVVTDPQRQRGLQTLQVSHVALEGRAIPGELYVTTTSRDVLKRGDTVELHGKLKPGFATYQKTISYAEVTSVSRSADIIRDIRERFVDSVRHYVTEPMASLGIGFVVGQRTALPPSLDDQLRIVGLTHIVVASGYNLTILVRFARRLLARHSRYLAFIFSLVMMLAFVAFSGLSPSMNRAVIVTGLSLLAWYYGRRFHPLMLIGYVAAGTALWNPVYIWVDLGWYLSFFAFAGVLIIAPLIARVLYGQNESPAFAQLIIETLSAELMTLPLIALTFSVFPTFGLLANVLVGPVIPFAMMVTTIAGLAGMIVPILAPFLAIPASVVIGYVVWIIEWLASMNWAQLPVTATPILVCCWFAAVLLASLYVWRRTGHNFRTSAVTD